MLTAKPPLCAICANLKQAGGTFTPFRFPRPTFISAVDLTKIVGDLLGNPAGVLFPICVRPSRNRFGMVSHPTEFAGGKFG